MVYFCLVFAAHHQRELRRKALTLGPIHIHELLSIEAVNTYKGSAIEEFGIGKNTQVEIGGFVGLGIEPKTGVDGVRHGQKIKRRGKVVRSRGMYA